MKLKFTAAIVTAIFVCSLVVVPTFASAASYDEADSVLRYIYGTEKVFEGNEKGTVTRGAFTAAVVKALKLTGNGSYQPYNDVNGESTENADEIYIAQELGIVSAGESFMPDNAVTAYEAVKIVVAASGCDKLAQAEGGYPYGYISAARRLDLLKNVNIGAEYLAADDAKMLIFNLLNLKLDYKVENGIGVFSSGGSETLLHMLYNLRRTEGIINRTPYSSRRADAEVSRDKFIEINGDRFDCESVEMSMLGKHAAAYYDDDSEEIIAVVLTDNTEIIVNLDDFYDLNDSHLYYYQDGKRVSKRIAQDIVMIYNGRAEDGIDKSKLAGETGTVRLLDNDKDNVFDYLFVDSYRYMIADKVFYNEITLSDLNHSEKLTVDLASDLFIVQDIEGKDFDTDALRANTILAVAATDSGLTRAVVCGSPQIMTIDSINLTERKLYSGGAEYHISEYALGNYKHLLAAGTTCSLGLGINNDVVYLSLTKTDAMYAYLMKTGFNETMGDGSIALRLLTEDGKIDNYYAEKIRIDGSDSKISASAAFPILKNQENELIRITLDGSGKLTNVDIATVTTDVTEGLKANADNSLRKNDLGNISFTYRSAQASCSPYFNLKGTIVFRVPIFTDSARDYDYSISTHSALGNGGSYSTGAKGIDIYNINEEGSAGAIVWHYDNKNPSYTSTDSSYLVDEIAEGILPDGTLGKILTCYTAGSYQAFYLENDTNILNTNGTGLGRGDIVEMKFNQDMVITSIRVDFDASSKIPAVNTYSGTTYQSTTMGYNGYSYGKAYYSHNGFAWLAPLTEDGSEDYSAGNLKNYCINTTNIIKIERYRGDLEIRPISSDEIRDYVDFGTKNDFIVIRQNYHTPRMVFVYRDSE